MRKLMFVVLLFSCISFVRADGVHFSSYDLQLFEPSQKALISWNGETEEMILTSAFKSDNFADFAWVVPIQSSVKPEVVEADASIFGDLHTYFRKPSQTSYDKFPSDFAQTGGIGVQVVETKEIDIYDITILNATNSSDLVDWLNDNGFMFSESSVSIFDDYVNQGDYYFVANKIDLSNKYDDYFSILSEIESAQNISGKTFCGIEKGRFLKIENAAKFLAERIVANITVNKTWDFADRWFYFFSKEDYEILRNKYAYSFNKALSENASEVIDDILDYADTNIDELAFVCYNSSARTREYLLNVDSPYEVGYNLYCEDLIKDFGSLDNYVSLVGEISFSDLKAHFLSVVSEVELFIDEIVGEIDLYELELLNKEYYYLKNDMSRGMGTPLKFVFKPEIPTYPLEISSLNRGSTSIHVFVVSESPVKDSSGVLYYDRSLTINSDLMSKLEKQINVSDSCVVTRLTFDDELKYLEKDAFFVENKGASFEYPVPKNFLETIIYFLKSLFKIK